MKRIEISAYELAQRFIGISEVAGNVSNPQILAMLKLDCPSVIDDEVPWCSAFVNYIAWLLRLPRSQSLRARSWLNVGEPIPLEEAHPGFDVVILKREAASQPGPEIMDAPGHVGFFAGYERESDVRILVLGGNQADMVNIASYSDANVLGIRRLR